MGKMSRPDPGGSIGGGGPWWRRGSRGGSGVEVAGCGAGSEGIGVGAVAARRPHVAARRSLGAARRPQSPVPDRLHRRLSGAADGHLKTRRQDPAVTPPSRVRRHPDRRTLASPRLRPSRHPHAHRAVAPLPITPFPLAIDDL
uniref:Uncharacterized protein n=1 Tax=Oryza glumipatula TaxID=40148 RepID=A0A0D9ZLL6_9ORYZ